MRAELSDRLVGELGEVVVRLRKTAHISQSDLARMAGINRSYLSELERGLRCPSITILVSLASAFGMSTSALVADAERLLEERQTKPLFDLEKQPIG